MDLSLGKFFGLKNPTVGEPFDPKTMSPVIMGIELELENIFDWDLWIRKHFVRKEDGSLRNHGSEFVSVPLHKESLIEAVKDFYQHNKVGRKHISERCSVHVHVNCLDLTTKQITNLCKTYQVFETLFFEFAGEDRDKSIFCVPWHQTNLTAAGLFKEPLNIARFKNWQKYTAVNLLPLFTQGTVEFRHLPGQPEVTAVVDWIELIAKLYTFSIAKSPEELESVLLGLNTTSQYDMLVDTVFGDKASLLKTNNYKELLEQGVLDLKMLVLDNYLPAPVAKEKQSATTQEIQGEINRLIRDRPLRAEDPQRREPEQTTFRPLFDMPVNEQRDGDFNAPPQPPAQQRAENVAREAPRAPARVTPRPRRMI